MRRKGTFSFQLSSMKAHKQTSSHRKESLAVKAALKPSLESAAGKMLVQLNKSLNNKLTLKFRTVHALAIHYRPCTDYNWQGSVNEIKVD